MLTLGFTGRAGAGKSSAADAILERCSRNSIRCGIYDIGREVLRLCVAEGLLPDKGRPLLTPDELAVLVRIGKERRAEDPQFWLKRIGAQMEADAPEVALVPNVRYINEAQYVRARGGKIIRVVRYHGLIEHISRDRDGNDLSECEHLAVAPDYWLVANTDPWLLRRQAVCLFDHILEKQSESMAIR